MATVNEQQQQPAPAPAPAPPVAAAQKFVFSGGVACNTAAEFALLRRELRQYGLENLKAELVAAGWFECDEAAAAAAAASSAESAAAGKLRIATGLKPFNPFARIVSGQLAAPYGNHLQRLGMQAEDEKFFVAQNRPEFDEHWDSAEPEWIGKASMAQRHQFLLLRSLHWGTFNAATFGLDYEHGADPVAQIASLREALALVDESERVAREYARRANWGPNIGLYVHVYPLNSVQAFHLHVLDDDTRGPTFDKLNHKNLPLAAVKEVLQQEIAELEQQQPQPDASESVVQPPQDTDGHHSASTTTLSTSATVPTSTSTTAGAAASNSHATARAPAHTHFNPAAPTPFRVPIRLHRPGSSTSAGEAVPPDFLVCLLDQLHTAEQAAARRSAHREGGRARLLQGQDASGHVASLAADRPTHDRLPLVLAVTSNVPTTDSSSSSSSTGVGVGVSEVTLLQPSDAEAWLSAQPAEVAVRTKLEPVVALAHASRCPCRAPLKDDEDDDEHSCTVNEIAAAASLPSSAAAAAAATPVPAPLPQQHVRLAVVVVPTLLSTLHCSRCSTEALDAPLPRALLTRRPRSMRAFPASWVFPGGVCDAADRSLAHTGARELLEETGLSVDEAQCQLVAMWEAVFPVIRPMALPLHEPFQPKGRYLITMFAAPVHNIESAVAAAAASDDTTSASSSSPAPSAPLPFCLGCSPPASLQLCPTEVDASVWVSPHELEALRAHAAYTHTEREDELQKQQQQPPQLQEQQSQLPQPPSQRCLAGTESCECAELPAMVTRAFLSENGIRARLVERSEVSSSLSSSSTATTGASEEPVQQQFLPALVRCCVLFGLYPNREGSGVAEGHLVALEEMREQGLFA